MAHNFGDIENCSHIEYILNILKVLPKDKLLEVKKLVNSFPEKDKVTRVHYDNS